MTQGLYLGKEYDPATKALGDKVELDPADLLTHGLIVGMTGSGKTGLAIALIEEVLRQGISVLAIDPKGDLGNLLLQFPGLSKEEFAPWIDEETAKRAGQTKDQAAEEAAATWTKGLADWGLGKDDIAKLKASHEATIYTPGSTAGVPLNILQSLDAPATKFEDAAEDLRDEIAGIVSGILGLLKIDADPLQSREYILLSNIIEDAWRKGQGLSLEGLITAVADPPFDKVGALPLESVFKRKDRQALMTSLNNLLAAPSFEVWRTGEPLDMERMLGGDKTRLSVVYTAHLSDEERLFVTALLLDKVKTWMRRQGGTSELRALVYMDEIFGYFPPHPANPPTKRPLLTLLKQARAQGVGIVLATQNPVDIDYKGLSNMGTWMVGTLQTEQDRARLREGLLGAGVTAASLDKQLDATKKRVFFLHDVHRKATCLLNSRFAMSYLRGPLTRDEIRVLTQAIPPRVPEGPGRSAAPTGLASGPPILPSPFTHSYYSKYGGQLADPHLFVKYAAVYKGVPETVACRAYPLTGASPMEMLEGTPLDINEAKLSATMPPGLRFSDLPPYVSEGGARAIEKALRDRLDDKLSVTVFYDPVTKTTSAPGETREMFAAAIASTGGGAKTQALRDKLEKKKADLAQKQQEVQGRKSEKWMAIGGAVLSNVGILFGRKRSITLGGANTAMTKNRMENTAEAKVEGLQAEIADLEAQLATGSASDPSRFEEKTMAPSVKLLRYDAVWVY